MPIAYPAGLPTVLASKRTSKAAAFSVASPRRGTPYVEPTGTDTPTVFDVEWLLSESDAAALVNWVEVTLERGTLEFTIPLRTETGLREITGNFLPDGLLDRSRDGPLWRYRASIVSRTGTGPLIVPAPPPPPPPPPPPIEGRYYSAEFGAVIFTAGESGSDVGALLDGAAFDADALGVPLRLPPWPVHTRRSVRCNKVIGVRGKSAIVAIGPSFDASSVFAQEWLMTNRNFTQGWNEATADDVYYVDFDVRLETPIGGIGIGGTKRSRFAGLKMTASTIIESGRPRAIPTLIDYYCVNRNGEVTDCDLINATGAWGAGTNRFAPDGGACIWVRNFRGSALTLTQLTSSDPGDIALRNAEADEWVTENIRIHGNRFVHMTSDEVVSIYGVTGITRNCRMYGNSLLGLPTIGGTYHTVWLSIFPLRFNSGGAVPLLDALGKLAGVHDNHIYDNDIDDAGTVYNVLRIGSNPNPGDTNSDGYNKCYGNKSYNNRVHWRRNNDPVLGSQAMWVSYGSVGANPDIASSAIRCEDGVFGFAYTSDTSGNTSTDDVAQGSGRAINQAFVGWQRLTNPECYGNFYIGISNCRAVFGGKVEAAAHCFFNTRSVVGTNYRCNLPGGYVFYVGDTSGGAYGFKDTNGESFGGLVRIEGSVDNGFKLGCYNNDCTMTGAASGYPALFNGNGGGATIVARNNSTSGANSAITGGAGIIDRQSNNWNGTNDNPPVLNGGNAYTGAQTVVTQPLTDEAVIITPGALSNHFTVTLAGNRTLAFPTGLRDGGEYVWRIKQDGTGGRTLGYGTGFRWPGGTVPTLSTAANAVDRLTCHYNAADGVLECELKPDFR